MPTLPTSQPDANCLRIVLASSQRGWHGGEGQARLLATGLRNRGHEVHLLARKGEIFAQRMSDENFPVTQLFSGGRSVRGVLQARRAIRQIRPDILHANDSHAMTCLLLASFGMRIPARIASRRVIYPIHTPAKFLAFADRITCVSTATVEACRAASLPESLLALVFSGVDPSCIETADSQQARLKVRQKLGLSPETTLLLCVGKLTEAKGHSDLLEAMPDVLEKRPHLVLALAGNGELLPQLQKQADRLGIASNVRFLGYRNDIPNLLHAADLYVQPSRSEGLCNAVIDAMLARCPIVLTARGGLLDLIPLKTETKSSENSDTLSSDYGWPTPPENPKRLAATMLEVLNLAPETRRQNIERAYQRARNHFTADHMVDDMLRVYRETLQI